MPTGHGGGHFSGGSGGGSSGGHFGGGYSGGGRRRGVVLGRPVFIYSFGRRNYYIGEKKQSLINTIGLFLFIAIIILIAKVGNYFEAKDKVEIIKSDFVNYNAIIDDAKLDSNKIVTGSYVGREEKYDKWCVKYKFTYNGTEYNGYSFYVYTEEEINEFKNDGLQIAIGNVNVVGQPDSIEMTFEGKELKDDGEYVYYSSRVVSQKVWMIVSSCVIGGLLISEIVISSTSFKKYEKEDEGKTILIQEDNPSRTCAYCGSKMKDDATSCPYCGAGENTFKGKSDK